ncbi:MAG TPA: Mur ligase family protein [Actinomycetes bacterium]|nr:Mur ligase family protein [Actinomycetes bacterium]
MTVDSADAAALQRVDAALRARWPESRIAPSLDRIGALMDVLGEPQTAYPVVLIAGTNGKTSTARMVEAVLRGFGLRTGRYTSPHLESMLERIALDGEPLSAEQFVAAYDEIAPYVELVDSRNDIPLSFFEVLTGMAYAAFADAPVDVAVVEVGMGGSWDATNVADAQVPVVMPIALDHTDYLGSTVDEIAVEKAGIVKHDALAVLAQQQSLAAAEAVLRRTVDVGATVAREGIEFGLLRRDVAVGGQMLDLQGIGGNYEDVFLPLHGPHQAHNAACALAAAEAFLGGGRERIDVDVVRQAFAGVTSPGRLEVVRRSPTVLLDAAHNPAGAAATTAAIHDAFTFTRLIGVIAVLAGKDARGILEALEPVLAEVVVTQNSSPRTLPADELAALAVDVFGADRVEVVPRMDDALDNAVTLAEEEGGLGGAGVLVTGSIVTVGDARTLLRHSG